jgi:hypothetical protein
MDESPFEPVSPAMQSWYRDLKQREARGEIKVQWHRAKEPRCVHSGRGDISWVRQPASACRFCKDGDELRAWKAYWQSLGVPE